MYIYYYTYITLILVPNVKNLIKFIILKANELSKISKPYKNCEKLIVWFILNLSSSFSIILATLLSPVWPIDIPSARPLYVKPGRVIYRARYWFVSKWRCSEVKCYKHSARICRVLKTLSHMIHNKFLEKKSNKFICLSLPVLWPNRVTLSHYAHV